MAFDHASTLIKQVSNVFPIACKANADVGIRYVSHELLLFFSDIIQRKKQSPTSSILLWNYSKEKIELNTVANGETPSEE